MEYKFRFDDGEALLYSWKATGPVNYEHQQSPHECAGDNADGFAYLKYNVGTTIMFSSVEVVRPQRMTIAIGVWISLPVFPPPSASGISARPAAIAVIRMGTRRSCAPRSTASRKSVTPSLSIRCWMCDTSMMPFRVAMPNRVMNPMI